MTKIYAIVGDGSGGSKVDWVRDDGEVLKRRPAQGAYTVPTALVMIQQSGRSIVLFCAERRTGSYEHMSHCDGGRSFGSREEARAAQSIEQARHLCREMVDEELPQTEFNRHGTVYCGDIAVLYYDDQNGWQEA